MEQKTKFKEEHNWAAMPDRTTIQKTIKTMEARGINVISVSTKDEALAKIKELVPKDAEVMNGSSRTLAEIGFSDYLKSGSHGWVNLHGQILNEKDAVKQKEMRRRSLLAEYFFGSVNAITEDGILVACDASGSRVGAYLYAAKHLVLVAGIQKITKNLDDAMARIREYVLPLEDQRMKSAYGMGSTTGKWIILEKEFIPGRITFILVNEKLGF